MSDHAVPIIVVFTQFDKLVSREEQALTDDELDMPDNEVDTLVLERANKAFQTSCVDRLESLGRNLSYEKVSGSINSVPLGVITLTDTSVLVVRPQHRKSLSSLVDITQELVHRHVEGDVWIVSAMAQRASAQSKIDSSIACAACSIVTSLLTYFHPDRIGMKRQWSSWLYTSQSRLT